MVFCTEISTGGVRAYLKNILIFISHCLNAEKLAIRIDKESKKFWSEKNLTVLSHFPNGLNCGDVTNFEPAKRSYFEGKMLMIPNHSEDILAKIYGDYMKLPPESERVGHHSVKFYRK